MPRNRKQTTTRGMVSQKIMEAASAEVLNSGRSVRSVAKENGIFPNKINLNKRFTSQGLGLNRKLTTEQISDFSMEVVRPSSNANVNNTPKCPRRRRRKSCILSSTPEKLALEKKQKRE